jgi:magnesium transporter
LLNGLFLSLIVLAITLLFFGNQRLSIVVSIALFGVVMFSSFVGTVTPLILNRLGFNPALASGPFITTMSDLLGLTTYFLTIHLML